MFGTVVHINFARAYLFIRSDATGENLFSHKRHLIDLDFDQVHVGQRVSFRQVPDRIGNRNDCALDVCAAV